MTPVDNYKVRCFPEGVSSKDKMLKDGKPVEKISFYIDSEHYTIEYNPQEKNYWTREVGYVRRIASYKDGILHGKFRGYDLTPVGGISIDVYPRLAVEGHYINGKKVGRWYYHKEDGSTDVKLFIGDKEVAEYKGKGKVGETIKDSYLVLARLKGKGSK